MREHSFLASGDTVAAITHAGLGLPAHKVLAFVPDAAERRRLAEVLRESHCNVVEVQTSEQLFDRLARALFPARGEAPITAAVIDARRDGALAIEPLIRVRARHWLPHSVVVVRPADVMAIAAARIAAGYTLESDELDPERACSVLGFAGTP